MKPDSSGSLIDRILAWLRGFVDAGKGAADSAAGEARRTARDATDSVREGVDDAERKARDLTDRRDRKDTAAASTGERDGHDLPDLADEPSGGGRSSFDTTTSASSSSVRDAASTYRSDAGLAGGLTDEEVEQRSDFDDAAGDWETGEETYPPTGVDLGAATHVHDAIGGEDERADDSTDGIIDTTRDADLSPGGTEGYQGREVSLQDQLIVDEGASSDEFDGDEIVPGDADNPYVSGADVESAAAGYGDTTDTDLSNTSDAGTSTLTGSTFTETDVDVPPIGPETTSDQGPRGDQAAAGTDTQAETDEGEGFHVVERYNYGMGDLGVGAGTTPDDAWEADAGPDVTTSDIDSGLDAGLNAPGEGEPRDAIGGRDASVSPGATRTEIESQSRGDAVNRSDEATQTPGFGGPETFDEAAAGTTEPSRSATGNELADDQDALGTTLDVEAESNAFDEDAANLSAQDELGVSDAVVGDTSGSGGTVERVATFQSGTIAHEAIVSEGAATIDEAVTSEAYADLPDEPAHETADDAGVDDFSGDDYPSDRRVDTLAGDDFTDAEVPDVLDLDSSAGDLDMASTDVSVDDVTAPAEGVAGDAGGYLDQDLVGTSDEHVGGEEPDFAEQASRGTDETGFDDLGTEAQAVDEALAADDVSRTVDAEPGLDGRGLSDDDTLSREDPAGAAVASAGSQGSGTSTGGREAPAGSVPGDGGIEAPEGYPVKGNASSMIYHLPDFPSYRGTKAEFYFATEQDALNAGYRAPGNVRRHASGGERSGAGTAGGGVTGDETSHVAPGEVAFDERLSDDPGPASQSTADVAAMADTDSDDDIPAGAVRGDGTTDTPDGFPVKGNASSKIYHLPSFPSYTSTKAEFCFATEEDAVNAGYRAPGKRNRGRKS